MAQLLSPTSQVAQDPFTTLRPHFYAFARYFFASLHPGAEFQANWHLRLIASRLQDVMEGRTKRLIINVPPRSLKSFLGSVAFPAFCLGHHPARQVICVSYAQELAEKLSRDCRNLIGLQDYQWFFPTTQLSRKRQAVGDFETTAHGGRMATSVGGTLTGRGADLLIIDDPLKPTDALSDLQRKAVNDWYANTLLSRLNDKKSGRIIVIMQCLHEDDLTGYLLEQGGFEHLCLPAIAEQEEIHRFRCCNRAEIILRQPGDALHPEREFLQVLEELRRSLGDYNFAGQYQQQPAPRDGGLIKRQWLESHTYTSLPDKFDSIVQSWDTANKATELSDFNVCTTWGVRHRQLYLIDVFRQRLDFPDLVQAVKLQAAKHKAAPILVEDKASETQLIQLLQREGMLSVLGVEPHADKIVSMHGQTQLLANGCVHLPQSAPWLADYINELLRFPNGRHDDQVDSTSQMLTWFSTPYANQGLMEYYQQLVAGLSAASAA